MLHTDAGAPSANDHNNPIIAATLQIIFSVSMISNCSLVLVKREVTPMPTKAAPTNRARRGVITVKPKKDRIQCGAMIKGRAKRISTRKWILNHLFKLRETSFFISDR